MAWITSSRLVSAGFGQSHNLQEPQLQHIETWKTVTDSPVTISESLVRFVVILQSYAPDLKVLGVIHVMAPMHYSP
jgi:hypothetical protein